MFGEGKIGMDNILHLLLNFWPAFSSQKYSHCNIVGSGLTVAVPIVIHWALV